MYEFLYIVLLENRKLIEIYRFRFQDIEEEDAELETTPEDNNIEPNNNSMFQENLETNQENSLMNSR